MKLNDPSLWSHLLSKPDSESHKYSRGHLLVYGAHEMLGASCLAARAAMRMGAGIVTVSSSARNKPVYQTKLPDECLISECRNIDEFDDVMHARSVNTVLIGPGFSHFDNPKFILKALDKEFSVIDGGALTCWNNATRTHFFEKLKPAHILTPHEGEFDSLFPEFKELDRAEKVVKAAQKAGCVICLKGSESLITDGERLVKNDNSSPYLATAGSGDVLAGMTSALVSQGMLPVDAALSAVWIHGKAAINKGVGLVASDLIEEIPKILHEIA